MVKNLKRLLVGQPLRSSSLAHERLSIFTALPILSSDALSSVAYATEEILYVLMAVSTAAFSFSLPISIAISALILVVVFSYRQVIKAYPGGGGAYVVASQNIGTTAGLVAGSALLIDYILTVAVSISSGVDAITSAVPALHEHKIAIALVLIALLLVANLRGVRESGNLFAFPTYLFLFSLVLMLVMGAWQAFVLGHHAVAWPSGVIGTSPEMTGFALVWLLARGFSAGCTALTGIETISNSVSVFEAPEQKNANKAMLIMGGMLILLFVGITILADAMHILPGEKQTVLSQVGRLAFAHAPFLYYLLQFATMLVLVLAANSAFAGFPNLASVMARDGFLPRQFAHRGDRLVFSNGVAILAIISGALIVMFHADTHNLLPLYAVGVFLSFTLAQTGMVLRHLRSGDKHRWSHASINLLGAVLSGIVTLVIAATKFEHGAWAVIILIPLLCLMFSAVKRHYNEIADELRMTNPEPLEVIHHLVVVPVAGVNRVVAATLQYAVSLAPEVHAVYVAQDPEVARKLKEKWERWNPGIPLEILPSPYRSLMEPLVRYLDRTERQHPNTTITILLPEFVPGKWWHHLLHNQSALLLKTALLFRPHTVVTSVPFHLGRHREQVAAAKRQKQQS